LDVLLSLLLFIAFSKVGVFLMTFLFSSSRGILEESDSFEFWLLWGGFSSGHMFLGVLFYMLDVGLFKKMKYQNEKGKNKNGGYEFCHTRNGVSPIGSRLTFYKLASCGPNSSVFMSNL